MANSFGLISRLKEAKISVRYPAEVLDDQDIGEHSIQIKLDKTSSFIKGWNFCTDLYRILEHIDGPLRLGRQTPEEEPGGKVTSFLKNHQSSKAFAADSQRLVSQLYDDLPDDLKKIKPITGDPKLDRHGFIGMCVLIT